MENEGNCTYSKVLKVYCDLCLATFEKRKTAEGYCVNCSKKLCAECCNYHKTLDVTKAHVVIQEKCNSEREMPVNTSTEKNDKCPLHRTNGIKYHCGSCDKFICFRCKSELHNHCSEVELISDATDDRKAKTMIETLQNALLELKRNNAQLVEHERKMKAVNKKTREEFEEHRENIIQSIQKMKSDFEMKTEAIEKDSQSKLKAAARLHSTLTSELESLIYNITEFQVLGKKCEMFEALRKAETDLPSIQNGLISLERDSDIENKQIKLFVSQMKALAHTVQGTCIRMQHT